MQDPGSESPLELSYPCEWPYVIIGPDEHDLRAAVTEIAHNRTHTITRSHTSAKGKYISLKVLVVVHSDTDRIAIYEALNKHPATKVVI